MSCAARRRPSRPPAKMLGVETVGPVLPIPVSQLEAERERGACLSAGLAHVPEFFSTAKQPRAPKVPLPFEGHRSSPCVRVWQHERRTQETSANGSLLVILPDLGDLGDRVQTRRRAQGIQAGFLPPPIPCILTTGPQQSDSAPSGERKPRPVSSRSAGPEVRTRAIHG